MKTLKAKDQFKIGKHNIGYINDRFLEEFKGASFEKRNMPKFQKLPRTMTDAEIESELKPALCELGDILAFLENPPEGTKDGYFNLFYFEGFVVSVFWDSYDEGWLVRTWHRGRGAWSSYDRVFSPATESSDTQNSSDTLTLERAIEMVKAEGYQIAKII